MHLPISRAAMMFAALLSAAPVARAQSRLPSTLGISAQVHGVGGTMNTTIHPGASGSAALGVGGDVSYGVTPRLSLVGRLARISSKSESVTESTDYAMLQGDLGIRWMFTPGSRVRPFAEASLALRRLAFEYADRAGVLRNFSAFNGGTNVNVGVMIFQTKKMSVEGAGTYTRGNFSTWKVNGKPESLAEMPSEMLGVRLGVRYWFER